MNTRQFGICMAGLEQSFESALKALTAVSRCVNYLEIGIAHGHTLAAVVEILRETGVSFEAVGVDCMPLVDQIDGAQIIACLSENLKQHWNKPVDLCFIDGCHACECVTKDFLLVESMVTHGGLALFHDFGILSQGGDIQSHCQRPIGVRQATIDLGLFDSKRPGWKRMDDWVGDASRNGATMGVFQKV